jgi:hypothetical protein
MFAWRIAAVALAVGMVGLSAADDKKPADSKAPDFAGWVKFGNPVVGEVVKANENGKTFTLKVATGVNRSRQIQYAQKEYMYHDAGLVRWKKLPPKAGEKGKPTRYSPEELAELRLPRGAPGYAADPDDLKPGYVLELTLVRPKEVPLSKLTPQDLRVQYAVILTEDKGATAGSKKDDEKKDEKKSDEKKKEEKKEEKKDEKKEEKKG